MKVFQHLERWLESHWVTPAYSGWVILALTVCFLLAASNTMAGWLYVISAICLALLAIAAILPPLVLHPIQLHRSEVPSISVGEALWLELTLTNTSNSPGQLLQVRDRVPQLLLGEAARAAETVIETLPAQGSHIWRYCLSPQRRGLYTWQTVQLRTGAPLGLFWCCRHRRVATTVVVYPQVLPLQQCPLLDQWGQSLNLQIQDRHRRTRLASEGLTRSVRPYRWGDPIRLVHWRSSARYGELRVRELELLMGGQQVMIGLDNATPWQETDFEQAVLAATALFFYARRRDLEPSLWTESTGLVCGAGRGTTSVLETLAAVSYLPQRINAHPLPQQPLIWLTSNPQRLEGLPVGSRWLLWSQSPELPISQTQGYLIRPEVPLQLQLQTLV
jgi:uncharacterized protein (DUF58 family)